MTLFIKIFNFLEALKKYFFPLFAAIVISFFVTLRVDIPNYEMKLKRHTSIIENTIEYPYKYRLLNPFIADQTFNLFNLKFSEKPSFVIAYAIQNFLVFFFLLYCLEKYFSLWFDKVGTILSLILFSMIIPITLTGYDVLGDMTTAGLMALGFYFINTSREKFLFPVLIIGAFNELQMILLIMFYFFSSSKNFKLAKVWLNFFLMAVTFLICYGLIYFLRGGQAGQEDFVWYFTKDAAFNISHKDWIPLWLLLITPLLIFALKNFKSKPEFLRRSAIFVLPLFYFAAFFFIARLREIDKALVIFEILIPLALMTLIPQHVKPQNDVRNLGNS